MYYILFHLKQYMYREGGVSVVHQRGITADDLDEGVPAAVLNSRAASQVFSEEEALGKILEIEGQPFQVVGIVGTGEEDVKEAFVLVPETIWPLLYQYEEPKSVVIRTETEERSAADYAARVLNSILPQNSPSLYMVQ